ncbi:hypothetical protein AB3R30_06555 [Leptolyngbyaceae cyanobacterium UHCC 1019]
MTSQKDQIQALIAEIDSVLQKANSRLPWVMSGEIAQQRQVLERVRNYLVVLQQQLPVDEQRQGVTYAVPIGYPPEFYPTGVSGSRSPGLDAQQMMQTILQEMSYLRASVMQPMQADLENLRQRRELLTQEVNHLETERQNQTFAQLSPNYSPNSQQFADDLVQVLMSRLQESLSQQIGQALGNVQAQALSYRAKASNLGEPSLSALANPQYEQLQALRSRSDQMLVNLDSTLNLVFESLQRNIQAYQASLTQGLERMHTMGQQSEVAFKTLIKELAQQLNQEASSYLLSLAQGQAAVDPKAVNPDRRETFSSTPEPLLESTARQAIANPSISSLSIAPNSSPNFPYPGMEVLATDLSTTDLIGSIGDQDSSLDAALEFWLRSTDSANFEGTELVSSLDVNSLVDIPLNDSAPAQAEVDFSSLSDAAIAAFGLSAPEPVSQPVTDADTTESNNDDFKFLEEVVLEKVDSELNVPLASFTLPVEDSSVEQDEFYQSLFGDSATEQTDLAKPEAIAFLNDLSNDLSSAVTQPKAAEPKSELDNIEQLAALADLTFESSGGDLELPELFLEEAKTESTFITELPASLFDDVSSVAQSLEPFPLTAEAESLLTDLDPLFSKPDSIGSLTDLFEDLPPELAQSTPTDPPATDPPAIARDGASPPSAAPMANPPELVQSDALTIGLPDSEFALEGRDDQFTRAALDENLLPDAFHETDTVSFNLDDVTLSSLSEDLSNVEAPTPWQSDDLATDDVPSLDEFALFLEDTQEVQPIEPLFELSSSDRADLSTNLSADLTIEEFGTLFDDAPNISPAPLPPAVSSSLPTLSLQETQSDPEHHTSNTAPPKAVDDGSAPFTLEGMDDLFGDAPDIRSVPLPPAPQPLDLSDPSLSSLGMQDLFDADPSSSPPVGTTLPFTLEGMDDLFSDAPSVQVTESPASRPATKEISPFKPNHGKQSVEESTPIKPDPLNHLEPEENTSNTLTDSLSENPSNTPIDLGLDEAFESLLGKPTALHPSTLNEQGKEKKKAL